MAILCACSPELNRALIYHNYNTKHSLLRYPYGGGQMRASATCGAGCTAEQTRERHSCPQKTGCNGTASAPVLTRAPLYLDKYNDTHALRHVRYGDGRRRAWVTRGAKTLCPSQTNNNSSTLLPTKIQLSTCSMRPCARTRSAPPQQIQKHEYIHCRAVHMRAGRGGRGATGHSPKSK